MKKIFAIGIGIVAVGLIGAQVAFGGSTSASNEGQNKTQPQNEEATETPKSLPFEEVANPVEKANQSEQAEEMAKLGEWVSEANEIIKGDLNDPRIEETNNDEGFTYYLKANAIQELLYEEGIDVENASIKKDLANFGMLVGGIGHHQFVRTAHIDGQGQAKEATEHSDQWKPTNERMQIAFDYMKQLLHDLNVAINHDGKGETYGVSYTAGGDNIDELEDNREWNGGEGENVIYTE